MPATASMDAVKAATLCLLNNERAGRGLVSLKSQQILEKPAAAYSAAMVSQRFFAHVSPSGQRLEQRLAPYIGGTSAWDIGENLAWGEGPVATPNGIVDAWMHSAEHKANILNPSFREIGIGIVNGTPQGSAGASSATYTTEFGSRSDPAKVSTTTVPRAASLAPTANKQVALATKRHIKAQCARSARKTKGTTAARKARAARCVSTRLRAARR